MWKLDENNKCVVAQEIKHLVNIGTCLINILIPECGASPKFHTFRRQTFPIKALTVLSNLHYPAQSLREA